MFTSVLSRATMLVAYAFGTSYVALQVLHETQVALAPLQSILASLPQ